MKRLADFDLSSWSDSTYMSDALLAKESEERVLAQQELAEAKNIRAILLAQEQKQKELAQQEKRTKEWRDPGTPKTIILSGIILSGEPVSLPFMNFARGGLLKVIIRKKRLPLHSKPRQKPGIQKEMTNGFF